MQLLDKYKVNLSNWPLQKIMGFNIVIICLVLIASGGLNFRSIMQGRAHNIKNSHELNDLSEKVDSLITTGMPFRNLVSQMQLAAQDVRIEIFRYVMEDEESPLPSQKAMADLDEYYRTLEKKLATFCGAEDVEKNRWQYRNHE